MRLIFLILLVVIIFVIYYWYNYDKMTFLKSPIDNKYYMVRNLPDKFVAVNLLATLRNNLLLLIKHLDDNKDTLYKDKKQYIEQLQDRILDVTIAENPSAHKDDTTSYSVNKGEELVICLRSKKDKDQFHDINVLMYVCLHEIAHTGCPEYGHTSLFKKIFAFFAETAVKLNLYKKIDFNKNPQEYCGITITDSII